MGALRAGAVAGSALEEALSNGLPKDELYVYKDALRRGRTVLVVLIEDTDQATTARAVLARVELRAARAVRSLGAGRARSGRATSSAVSSSSDRPLTSSAREREAGGDQAWRTRS